MRDREGEREREGLGFRIQGLVYRVIGIRSPQENTRGKNQSKVTWRLELYRVI